MPAQHSDAAAQYMLAPRASRQSTKPAGTAWLMGVGGAEAPTGPDAGPEAVEPVTGPPVTGPPVTAGGDRVTRLTTNATTSSTAMSARIAQVRRRLRLVALQSVAAPFL